VSNTQQHWLLCDSPEHRNGPCWASLVAQHYLERGWRPVPIDASAKEPRVKWRAYQCRAPTSSELGSWQPRFRNGVALVTGGKLVVIDVDTERPGFAETCQSLRDAGGAEVRTPSGGAHFYFSTDAEVASRDTERCEVHASRSLVIAPPSPGYIWTSYPDSELPLLPTWVAQEAKPIPAPQPATEGQDEDLAAYRALLPDLSFSAESGHGVARCPLHDDVKPSLGLYRGERDGKLLWRCFACKKGGTLERLRHELLKAGGGRVYADMWQGLLARAASLPVSPEARAVFAASLRIGLERDLNPAWEIATPYRTIARLSGVERVSAGNALSAKGRTIRAALLELHEGGYVSARIVPQKTTRVRILGKGGICDTHI